MTRLSLTLRLIPHCWPQKQQCVGTILSGSAPVSMRAPSMRLRCGPQASMRTSCSLGSVAMIPDASLRNREHRPPARGANPLIIAVAITELALHFDEVVDLQQRRVLLLAAAAPRHPF